MFPEIALDGGARGLDIVERGGRGLRRYLPEQRQVARVVNALAHAHEPQGGQWAVRRGQRVVVASGLARSGARVRPLVPLGPLKGPLAEAIGAAAVGEQPEDKSIPDGIPSHRGHVVEPQGVPGLTAVFNHLRRDEVVHAHGDDVVKARLTHQMHASVHRVVSDRGERAGLLRDAMKPEGIAAALGAVADLVNACEGKREALVLDPLVHAAAGLPVEVIEGGRVRLKLYGSRYPVGVEAVGACVLNWLLG